MSVYKRTESEAYSYDFQIQGHRFSGNTEARNKKDAEALEKRIKAKARKDLEDAKRSGEGPLLLREATGNFYAAKGSGHADNAGTHRDLKRLCDYFGPNKRMDEITDAEVAALVAWRRNQTVKGRVKDKDGNPIPKIAPATVNRSTTEVLKKVFTHAKNTRRAQFPNEPNWRVHWLKEPEGIVRELHGNEEAKLNAAMRGDYAPWLQFALLTGLRRRETLIKWENVNWDAGTITVMGKGSRLVTTFITPAVAALLEPLKGHHPEYVFTFVAQKTRKNQIRGKRYTQVKGERRPITYEGGKSEWQRLTAAAGVTNFRFHDLRHTTATRLLRKTGKIQIAQKALNHRNIATTARYAHVANSEVADALQSIAPTGKMSHGNSHAKPKRITQTIEKTL